MGFAGLYNKLNFVVLRSKALEITALGLQQVALAGEALSPVIQGFSPQFLWCWSSNFPQLTGTQGSVNSPMGSEVSLSIRFDQFLLEKDFFVLPLLLCSSPV